MKYKSGIFGITVPGPFLSEVEVTVLFSESGDVGHVEVEFQVIYSPSYNTICNYPCIFYKASRFV